MSKVIYKYDVDVSDSQTIDMPKGAQLLSVGVQNGRIKLWALIDPGEPIVSRDLILIGTGHPIIRTLGEFIGTVHLTMPHSGSVLVFHLFDGGELI